MGKINLKEHNVKGIWVPQEIGFVNNTALRIAKLKGDYKWHIHKEEDEFFLVIKGSICIDTEKETVELKEWEGYLVKAGLKHRSRASEVATVLIVEPIKTNTKGEK